MSQSKVKPVKCCLLTSRGQLWHCLLWCGQQAGSPLSWLPHPSAQGHHLACCHMPALSLSLQSVKKQWRIENHPGDRCPPQTMSSDPIINIDVITCCLRSLEQSRNPSCFIFLSSFPSGNSVFVIFLLTVLIPCYWLSLAHEQSCSYTECSVNRDPRCEKRGAQTYCVHKHTKLSS